MASQQQLLEDLRRLRESDALSLTEKAQEINELRTEVERLAGEIEVLRGVVEEGLNERRQGRDEAPSEQSNHLVVESPVPSVRRFIDDEEVDRISVDLDERRSERASNSSAQSDSSSSIKSATTTRSRRRVQDANEKPNDGAESNPPFPRIGSERMERLFFSVPRHNTTSCRMCKGHHHSHRNGVHRDDHEAPNDRHEDRDEGFDEGIEPRPEAVHPRETGRGIGRTYTIEEILERMDKNGGTLRPGDVPPQTVLARVVGELEDEFAHFREYAYLSSFVILLLMPFQRRVYSSLAEEYRSLDCATQVAKRHTVGDRLRDVIEVLERKVNFSLLDVFPLLKVLQGNQIASLYDLLIFQDKGI